MARASRVAPQKRKAIDLALRLEPLAGEPSAVLRAPDRGQVVPFPEARCRSRRSCCSSPSQQPPRRQRRQARPLIADLVTRFVESGRFARGGRERERLSPDGNFPDLEEHFLWTFTGSVNAAYNHVGVTNPPKDGAPAYPQSQLALVPTDQATGELKALLRADGRHHSWESDLLVQYAVTRLDPGDFEESRDLIRLRSAYKFRGLNALTGARWWTPVPFAEGQLESEFNAPADRGWHRLELTSIAGASLRLLTPLEVKVGLNLRRDMLRPQADTTWGLTAGLRLLRTDLFSVLSRPVQLEAELEYFFNAIGTGCSSP